MAQGDVPSESFNKSLNKICGYPFQFGLPYFVPSFDFISEILQISFSDLAVSF